MSIKRQNKVDALVSYLMFSYPLFPPGDPTSNTFPVIGWQFSFTALYLGAKVVNIGCSPGRKIIGRKKHKQERIILLPTAL